MKKMMYLVLSILCVGAQDAAAASRRDEPVFVPHDMDAREKEAHGVSPINNPSRVSRAKLYGSGGSVSASSAQPQGLGEAGYPGSDGGQPCGFEYDGPGLAADNKRLTEENEKWSQHYQTLQAQYRELFSDNLEVTAQNTHLRAAYERWSAEEGPGRLGVITAQRDAQSRAIKGQNRNIAILFGIVGADVGISAGLYAPKVFPQLQDHRLKLAAAGLVVGGGAGLLASRLCTEKPADMDEQGAAVNKEGMSRTEQACWLFGGVAVLSSGFAAYQWAKGHNYSTRKTVAAGCAGLGAPLLAFGGLMQAREKLKKRRTNHLRNDTSDSLDGYPS